MPMTRERETDREREKQAIDTQGEPMEMLLGSAILESSHREMDRGQERVSHRLFPLTNLAVH